MRINFRSQFARFIFVLGAGTILFVACGRADSAADSVTSEPANDITNASQAEAETETIADAEAVVPEEDPTATHAVPTPVYVEAPVILVTPDTSSEPTVLDISIIGGGLNTLDPQRANSDNAVELIENIFAGLTRYNEQINRVEGELAESWEISEDGRIWTFHLRQDIFWVQPVEEASFNLLPGDVDEVQMGEVQTVRQVVADDMVYAVQRICDPTTAVPDAFILFLIEGCENVNQQETVTAVDLDRIGVHALGPFTLQFQLTKPANQFLIVTTLPIMRPVPRDLIANTAEGLDWASPDQFAIASGPFLISSRSIFDTQIVLEKNPFWPIDLGGNIDIVNIYQLENIGESFSLWEDRSLELSELPISQQEDLLLRTPQKVQLIPEQAVFYLAYNFDSGVFSNLNLRRAFAAAIDREALVEQVYEARGLPMRHFVPPGVFGAPPINEIGVGYNPDFAREQLIAGGISSCRFLPDIRFLVSTSDTSLFQAELVREMWVEELGCDEEQIIIEQVQFGLLLANTRRDAGPIRPDIWELGWASYYPDSHNWVADVLHCAESDNRPNRPCSEVDELMRRAETAEPDVREQIFRRIERELFSAEGITPIVPLFVRAEYLLIQTWVESFAPSSFGGRSYDQIRIDAELKRIEREQ